MSGKHDDSFMLPVIANKPLIIDGLRKAKIALKKGGIKKMHQAGKNNTYLKQEANTKK